MAADILRTPSPPPSSLDIRETANIPSATTRHPTVSSDGDGKSSFDGDLLDKAATAAAAAAAFAALKANSRILPAQGGRRGAVEYEELLLTVS